MVNIGSPAPAWKGQDQHGVTHSLKEYAGKWLLLYFYPEDDTPGCTDEACGFRDHFTMFRGRMEIVGVSPDSVESHKKFAEKYKLPFTLISDPEKTILRAYGTDGKIFPKRTSFLINPDQTIEKIYQGFDPKKHASDIDADLMAKGV